MKYLIFAFCIITQVITAQESDNRGYKVNIGEQAPAFEFNLLDGSTITNETLKNKVVVLQFTASWCSVCRKEMPHLEKEVWQQFKNEDFLLIGIDLKEDLEKVKRFKQAMQVTYPMGIDTDGSIFKSFTLPKAGVTRNIVLDKNGKIIFLTRLFNEEEFNKMIHVIAQELNKN